MPYTPHVEQHFTGGLVVRDTVIGMSDGLTVPFALAAGLTGAVDSTTLVVTAGLAEIAAGSIAMGLGGYLAGKSDVEHYANERAREQLEIEQKPEVEAMEVAQLLQYYGLTPEQSAPVVEALRTAAEIGARRALVEPDLDLGRFVTNSDANYGKHKDPLIDELYTKQARAVEQEERKKYLRAFEKRLLDEEVHVFYTLQWHRIIPHNSKVKGWTITPSHYLNNQLDTVWLSE